MKEGERGHPAGRYRPGRSEGLFVGTFQKCPEQKEKKKKKKERHVTRFREGWRWRQSLPRNKWTQKGGKKKKCPLWENYAERTGPPSKSRRGRVVGGREGKKKKSSIADRTFVVILPQIATVAGRGGKKERKKKKKTE